MRNGKREAIGLMVARNPSCREPKVRCASVRGYFLVYLLKGIRNEKGEIINEEL